MQSVTRLISKQYILKFQNKTFQNSKFQNSKFSISKSKKFTSKVVPKAQYGHVKAQPDEQFDIPGLLRENLFQIEANLDDLSPQVIAHVVDNCFRLGAKDAWVVQCIMKKGRPAQVINAIASETQLNPLVALILKETTTLGVRVVPIYRYSVNRTEEKLDTKFGPITIKLGWLNNRVINVMPEYEECKNIAYRYNKSIKLVQDVAKGAWYDKHSDMAY